MKSIGVDVGGTFTDLVYCDLASGRALGQQSRDHAGGPLARRHDGHSRTLRRGGVAPSAIDYRLPRHDDGDQRGAGAQGRANRHDHQRGLPRHSAYRPASARRTLLDHAGIALAEPPADPTPLSQGREGPAVAPPTGEELGAAGRGRGAARRRSSCARRASSSSPSAFCSPISIPRMKTRALEIVREAMPDAFVTTSSVGLAAISRVRALHDRGARRLHRPEECAATSIGSTLR